TFKGYLYTSYKGNSRHIKCPEKNLEKKISDFDIPKKNQRWYVGADYGILFFKQNESLYAVTFDENAINDPVVVHPTFGYSYPLSIEYEKAQGETTEREESITAMGNLEEFSQKVAGVFSLKDIFVIRLRTIDGSSVDYRYFKITMSGVSEINMGLRIHGNLSEILYDNYYPCKNGTEWFKERRDVIENGILVRYWLKAYGAENLCYAIVTLDGINLLNGILHSSAPEYLYNRNCFPQTEDASIITIKEYNNFENGILVAYCTSAYQTDCAKFAWVGTDCTAIRRLGAFTYNSSVMNIAQAILEESEYENGQFKYLDLQVTAGGAPYRVLVNQYGIYYDDGDYPRINEIECLSKNEIHVTFKKGKAQIGPFLSSIDAGLDTENPRDHIAGTTLEIISDSEQKTYLTIRNIKFDSPKSAVITLNENLYLETNYRLSLAGYKTLFGCRIPFETPETAEFEGCYSDLLFNPCDSNVTRTNMKKMPSDAYVTPINGQGEYFCDTFHLPASGYWYAEIVHNTGKKRDFVNQSVVDINGYTIDFNRILKNVPGLPLSDHGNTFPLIVSGAKGANTIKGTGKISDPYDKDEFGTIRFSTEFPDMAFGGYVKQSGTSSLHPYINGKTAKFHFFTNLPIRNVIGTAKRTYYKKSKTYDKEGNLIKDEEGNIVYHLETKMESDSFNDQNNGYRNFWFSKGIHWPEFDMKTAEEEKWIPGNSWKFIIKKITTDNPRVFWEGEKTYTAGAHSINNIRYICHYPRVYADIDEEITVEFSSDNFASVWVQVGTTYNPTDNLITGSILVNSRQNGKKVIFTPQITSDNPSGLWEYNKTYYARVLAAGNFEHNVEKKIYHFSTKNINNLFQFKSSFPGHGYDSCSLNQIFTLKFNYDINENQDLNEFINIYRVSDNQKIESAAYIDPEDKKNIVLFPVEAFTENTEYKIIIRDELKNTDTVNLYESATVSFKTIDEYLRIIRCTPVSGANIYPEQKFILQFNYALKENQENFFKLFEKNKETEEYDIPVACDVIFDNNLKNIVHINVKGPVCLKSYFRLFVLQGLESTGGVILSSNRIYAFKSASAFDQTKPDEHNNTSPSSQGCPIDLYSGSSIHAHTDIIIPSAPIPLSISRKCSSARKNYLYGFGRGWESPIFERVYVEKNGATNEVTGLVQLRSGTKVVRFERVYDNNSIDSDSTDTYSINFINKDDFKTSAKVFENGTVWIEDSNLKKEFNQSGYISKISDKNNRFHEYIYDNEGSLLTISDSTGQAINFIHDSNGLITNVSSTAGHSVNYTYDRTGNLLNSELYISPGLSVTGLSDTNESPAPGTYQYEYDTSSRLTQITWPDNSLEKFVYNSEGKCAAWTKNNKTESIEYLDSNLRKFYKPNNTFNLYQFNNDGRL
ncbi:MAG: hypothetical protein JXR90_05000, partial [Spirochaetes bacterium]|nr:hypothetical protein [Spirochaetota bacterium]